MEFYGVVVEDSWSQIW